MGLITVPLKSSQVRMQLPLVTQSVDFGSGAV